MATKESNRRLPLKAAIAAPVVVAGCWRLWAHIAVLDFKSGAPWRDLVLWMVLLLLILPASRRWWMGTLLTCALMSSLYAAMLTKAAVWGWPLTPDDLLALPELLKVLPRHTALAITGCILIATVFFLASIAPKLRSILALSVVIALAYLAWRNPSVALRIMEGKLQHSVWNETANFKQRGALLYFASSWLRKVEEWGKKPAPDEVERILSLRMQSQNHFEKKEKYLPNKHRPIFLILMESFWDPSRLSAAGFDKEPMAPAFLALWRRTGKSTALSGEFAGATANPEFEVLCGVPARLASTGVAFKSLGKRDLPCLPNILASRGWKTEAFHPNVPDFWNRSRAYSRLGFDVFRSSRELVMDDTDGEYLFDASLYRQALKDVTNLQQPFMAYILTITGHWPYKMSAKRPPMVACHSKVPEVCQYSRVVWHTSTALAGFVDLVMRRFPNALVVALGDHAPFLGPKLKGYMESGVVSIAWIPSMSADELLTISSVPLLIINGRLGPVRAGTIAQYQLTPLILELLGIPAPGWMRALQPQAGGAAARSLSYGMLVVGPDGESLPCVAGDKSPPPCSKWLKWRSDEEILARAFIGGLLPELAP